MSVNFSIASETPTSVDKLTDLEKAVDKLPTELRLGVEFAGHLDQSISTQPGGISTSIQYTSGNQCWKLGDFSFTLSGGVTGKLSVITPGKLLSYTDDLPTEVSFGAAPTITKQDTKSIPVPPGAAYIGLEMDFQIKGGISANITEGVYGVCGSVSSKDTFSVSFYKRCNPADRLRDAIATAFSDFVLPLHAETLSNLKVGDYLHHNFNGNLQVGLGASIGYDKVFYAGQYKADIPDTAGALKLTMSTKDEFQAGAKLAFQLEYAGTFEALLWKDAANAGRLHLYRSQTQDASLGLSLGVTLAGDPKACATAMSSQLHDCFKKVVGGLGNSFDSKVWPKAAPEIGNCVNEANSKIAGWLKHVQGAQATLDFAIEKTNETFLLMDYSFDLTAPAYATAWGAAIAGKYMDALQTPNGGVAIAVGSGLEKFYDKKTSVTLNLFGKLSAAWTDAIISDSTLVYAGNNVFHLMADAGRSSLYQLNKSKREIDIYFAAQANLESGTTKLGTIDLHVMLSATDNQAFGKYIAGFLQLLTSGPDATALVKAIDTLAAQPKATEVLQIILPPATYGRLQSSTINNGRPDDQTKDQSNYAAFARACSDLSFSQPSNFASLTYGVWSNWNIACNDSAPPPNAVPNRRALGDTAGGVAQLQIQSLEPGVSPDSIGYALHAASDFMNFCEDLKNLAQAKAVEGDLDSWNKLVDELKSIIENDVSPYFIAPTGLALVRLCAAGALPGEVKGPAPGCADKNSIAVTLTYS
jgi:hypothetical protein